jgi:hypothetical protein
LSPPSGGSPVSQFREAAAGNIENVVRHLKRDHKRAVVTKPELGTGGDVWMLNVGIPDIGVCRRHST